MQRGVGGLKPTLQTGWICRVGFSPPMFANHKRAVLAKRSLFWGDTLGAAIWNQLT
jgi:hypothetical protein